MKPFFSTSRKAAFFGIVMGLSAVAFPAMANLSITPTIVVIEGRDRYADVHLVNPTDTMNNYEVHWRFYRMEDGSGSYVETDKSVTDWDLSKHLVFTPRRVAIEPQLAQKVRLGLRLGGEPPPPGDYRAHLEFMKVPDPVAAPSKGPAKKEGEKGKASVGVMVNVGFSIPVIYRVGESDAKATIGDVKTEIKPGSGKIQVVIPVTKSKSPYGIAGDISIYYNDKVVGQVKNANIFPEITQRTFTVPLIADKLSGGSLRIVYKDFSKKKDLVYAEKTVPIAN